MLVSSTSTRSRFAARPARSRQRSEQNPFRRRPVIGAPHTRQDRAREPDVRVVTVDTAGGSSADLEDNARGPMTRSGAFSAATTLSRLIAIVDSSRPREKVTAPVTRRALPLFKGCVVRRPTHPPSPHLVCEVSEVTGFLSPPQEGGAQPHKEDARERNRKPLTSSTSRSGLTRHPSTNARAASIRWRIERTCRT